MNYPEGLEGKQTVLGFKCYVLSSVVSYKQ